MVIFLFIFMFFFIIIFIRFTKGFHIFSIHLDVFQVLLTLWFTHKSNNLLMFSSNHLSGCTQKYSNQRSFIASLTISFHYYSSTTTPPLPHLPYHTSIIPPLHFNSFHYTSTWSTSILFHSSSLHHSFLAFFSPPLQDPSTSPSTRVSTSGQRGSSSTPTSPSSTASYKNCAFTRLSWRL